MKIYSLLLLFTFSYYASSAQELEKRHHKIVLDFIQTIKSQNKKGLALKTLYPLKRQYPIPAIENKQDLINRYDTLFDEKLAKTIVNSNPATDWQEAGSRGIMLLNGIVWLDYDGKLRSINNQTSAELKLRNNLIKTDKDRLNPALKSFISPMVILETSKFLVRIDDLGSGNYRYVSWPLKSSMKDKPALILTKGQVIPEGSGGNHKYVFKNGLLTYECAIINVVRSSNMPDALLTIYKDDEKIFSSDAKIL